MLLPKLLFTYTISCWRSLFHQLHPIIVGIFASLAPSETETFRAPRLLPHIKPERRRFALVALGTGDVLLAETNARVRAIFVGTTDGIAVARYAVAHAVFVELVHAGGAVGVHVAVFASAGTCVFVALMVRTFFVTRAWLKDKRCG